ncbi:ADP-ribosylglycohydrolase family protein [Anaeromyxobacter paludicola]|uniref:ADP-ribosylglycohydrolase n=1 Tax=Anaeromyxobacter paludicola TaxID=2918171 RepID=A0ABN6N8N6_9BACT|nr:ADP-ribosylglycohydrolase family protein [Anaeromyxobacter paludicola]BDG08598.1 ADP-ribosylglycohydrolase [Anaeromyxobacter paludicola]
MPTTIPPEGPARSRARGAVLGLAVGDALGTTLEFTTPAPCSFRALISGPHDELTGGGPFSLEAGQITDDTQMASCLALSLRERRGFDADDVASRYLAWRDHAFDIGSQTSAALAAIANGTRPADAGREVWQGRHPRPAGNGSLMRTAPIGVAFAMDPAARRDAALRDSALTHYDPRCLLACTAFDAALAAAITGAAGTREEVLAAAREELEPALLALRGAPGLTDQEVREAAEALAGDLHLASRSDPLLYGPDLHLHTHQGFVRVAFRLAFWELLHAPDFRSGLVDVVNRGGDADTNGAIAGALLGAFFGAAAIPRRWTERVLGALEDRPGPLRDLYHPRRLLELVDG